MLQTTLFASGHLTDDNRNNPRFPDSEVPRVQREVREVLRYWRVDETWKVVVGGARGADIIVAEEAVVRGASVKMFLALPFSEFLASSVERSTGVQAGDIDWRSRFDKLICNDQVDVTLPPYVDRGEAGRKSAYSVANDRMLAELPAASFALLIWDGQRSSRPGGTWEVVERVQKIVLRETSSTNTHECCESVTRLRVIDPTPREYEARQQASETKRILSLDGGGIRGILSLEVLAKIERSLDARSGHETRLSEYFDYIAGTSTGAIIAAGLASGRRVQEIADLYTTLGKRVFRPSARALPRLARYSDRTLTRLLSQLFPANTLLGHPNMKSLLLLVLHNMQSDSPWILSNSTRAKYNSPDRMLGPYPDRNILLPLIPLLRASCAAPTYFPPQRLTIGRRVFDFQDGGLTPFNNPALITAITATLPAYGLSWRTGADRLLVVSVGTGSSAAIQPQGGLPLLRSASSLARIPYILMNGSAFSQDLLCRVMGKCVYGLSLDRELGDLVAGPALGSPPTPQESLGIGGDGTEPGYIPGIGDAFTYVRYDADLSDEGLKDLERRARESFGKKVTFDKRRIRRLDQTSSIDDLKVIGRLVAGEVNIERHFAGFLPLQTD